MSAYRNASRVCEITRRRYFRFKEYSLHKIKKRQYLDMYQWMLGDIPLKANKVTMARS